MADIMKCPQCGDEFELSRPDGVDGMAPWFLDVYHDHEFERPRWVGVVYQHVKGQRYPKELKAIVEGRKASKKAAKAAVADDKRSAAEDHPTCPLHPEGCREHEGTSDVRR